MKILVADDSKTTRAMLNASLTRLGHEVIEATTGQQTIDLFQKVHPDLIILDVIMDEIDGFECAKKIRQINTKDWIPIIFLSGAVDDENISNGINAGGDDYLTKPYSEVTLAAKIKAMERIANMRHELFEMTKKFQALSATDSLTGIHNRSQFEETILEKISYAKRYNNKIALLFVDLDKFKIINDTLGHYAGDLLLKEVATRLKSCIRLDDFIARIGGDEFGIILNNIESIKVADAVAEKIIHAIEVPYIINGHNLRISSSIGISYFPSEESDEDNVIHNADIAMYHAKKSGRNNFQHYTQELGDKHNKRTYLENALTHAIENNELILNFHPIYNLKTRNINRIEVLLGWNNKEFGKLQADYFIPIAEEIEMIDKIGEWTLRQSCKQAKIWLDAGYNIKLSVNIFPLQLSNESFPKLIHSIIKETGIPADMIELELTETSSIIYSDYIEKILNEIRETGVNIALDDFGTGYSSLIYLKKLPINAIKIDKSFVHDITTNQFDSKIIKSIIALGSNLGFDVIAKGIESKEQLQCLIENDCFLGQGFYLSNLLTAEQMTVGMEDNQKLEKGKKTHV